MLGWFKKLFKKMPKKYVLLRTDDMKSADFAPITSARVLVETKEAYYISLDKKIPITNYFGLVIGWEEIRTWLDKKNNRIIEVFER